jgi:hypothetical protein
MQKSDAVRRQRGRRGLALAALAAACLAAALVRAPAAGADVPWPYQFMPYIEGYQPGDPQDTCDPTPKPGVEAFRDHLNFWHGSHYSGIARECSAEGNSEHKEGRALDYHVNVGDPVADQILGWVLAADEHGNQHAVARRVGLMYIIWNHQIFELDEAAAGWQPYNGKNPHTDHIHFSFSWAGANKQTSWWTTTQQTRSGCNSTVETWTFTTPYGPLVQIKRIEDLYGKVYDTQAEIQGSYWRIDAGGQEYAANQPTSVLASPAPVARVPVYDGVSGGWCSVPLT